MTLKGYQKSIIIVVVSVVLGLGAVVGVCAGAIFACGSVIRSIDWDHEINWKEVSEIAKNDYGCDKVLWAESFVSDTTLLPRGTKILSHNVYGVVVEKNGEELFLMIPCEKDESGFFADWKFDYSFTEIIAHMEALGIVFDSTDKNGDGIMYDGITAKEIFSDEKWYGKFDVDVYFVYEHYNENIFQARYYVVQKDHELRVYRGYQTGYTQLS